MLIAINAEDLAMRGGVVVAQTDSMLLPAGRRAARRECRQYLCGGYGTCLYTLLKNIK